MSSRIDQRFAQLARAGRTGLIPFVIAGDPLPEATVSLLHALVEAGADLLELGLPFSDPMADGPVIQRSSERALARGVDLSQVLAWVAEFRQQDQTTPVILMGYLNPVEVRGYARFAAEAAAAGVDGVLLVDCPLEESEVLAPLNSAGLQQILLAAPTTEAARLAAICERASGFLYYVSLAGITGAPHLKVEAVAERMAAIRKLARLPLAVGFGVRDGATAKAIAAIADAVVIGSALVERLAEVSSREEVLASAQAFLAPIRRALDAT